MAYVNSDEYREKHRIYMASWTKKNKKKHLGYNSKVKAARREWLVSLKSAGCSRCEEKHPACLDWHHKDSHEKVFNVAAGWYRKAIMLKEISKCELICSNCHRKLHYDERKNFRL